MTQYQGIEYMRRKLNTKRTRVLTRYKYYEMKNRTKDFGISTPPDLMLWQSVLGWCSTAVDALADRLVFRGFEDDNFELNGIFQMNNPDIIYDSAVLSAAISSCCFIYISPDETGYPRLQVIDGSNATGIIDPITGLLEEGYAVLKRDNDTGNPTREAYFTAEATRYLDATYRTDEVMWHRAGHPLLVPIVFRPDARRPFGHSRISRACMALVGSALRTIKRSEIAAEFFAYPQKYVTGLAEDSEPMEKWRATMASMLSFTKDEDGDHPIIGQFAQQSMEPHLAQLKMFASLFAGETGLTLDDLGFATANPASSEAIKAAHENLRYTARKAQRSFGSGFLNTGYLAACMRDNFPYQRRQFYLTKPAWEPIFEPDAAALSGAGDALLKLQQAFPDYVTDKKLYDLTGI